MSNKKIYTREPITRSEWIALAKEIGELALCVLALLALNWALETLAHWVV